MASLDFDDGRFDGVGMFLSMTHVRATSIACC